MKKLILVFLVALSIAAFGRPTAGTRSHDAGGGLTAPVPYEITSISE